MGKAINQRIEKGIYRRGAASFQVKMMVGGHTLSGTFENLDEARAYRNSKRASLSLDPDAARVLNSRVNKAEAKQMTLSVALDRYQREVSAFKKSNVKEAHTINKIKRAKIASMSLYRIAPEDVSNYMKSMVREQAGPLKGTPLSEITKRKHAALLSHLFNIARKRWRMNVKNPIEDIELPANSKPRNRRLEAGEEEKLIVELGKARNKRVLPLFRLSIETACRQGELLALEWQDVKISGDHGTALLRDTKNGEERIVPLSTAACTVLAGIPRPIKGGRVFPINEDALRTTWDQANKRAGISGLRWHDLRHEATSRFFEMGLDRIEAASITGHKTLQMLKDYTHLRAEKLAKKINQAQMEIA